MIPLHPERGASAAELRWRCPGGTFPITGTVEAFGVESPLTALIEDARIEADDTVTIRLRDGAGWDRVPPDPWSAVSELVEHSELWRLGASTETRDARVAAAVLRVLAGPFGDYVASHGGSISLVDVEDGRIRVRLSGACAGCAAAAWTLRMRLERDVTRECGGLGCVVTTV